MTNENEIFNPSDFSNTELTIEFLDITTQTKIGKREKVLLVEVGDGSLSLEVPEASCNLHHNIMLKIFRPDPKTKKMQLVFETTGKVEELEKLSTDKKLCVKVRLVQYDEKSWRDFLSIYSDRQEEISRFLAAAKG